MFSRRSFVASLIGGAAALSGTAAAAQTSATPLPNPPTLGELFRRARVGGGALSPKGGWAAVLGETGDAEPQATIDFYDTSAMGSAPRRTALTGLEAEKIDWASEGRLMVWVTSANRTRRVLTMNPDGSDQVVLFEHKAASRAPLNLTEIAGALPDDPDHVLMAAWDQQAQVPALYRVNVRSGQATLLERGGARTISWRCQGGAPVLRYDMEKGGKVMSLLARSPGEARWRLVRRIHRDDTRDFHVVGLAPAAGVVLVASRTGDEDAACVRTLDTRTMRLGEVLSSRPHSDVADVLTNNHDHYVAAAYFDDRRTYDFADPKMGKHFKIMNKAFGDDCNVELLNVDESQTRWLGRVSGPRQPGLYILYDRSSRRIYKLGAMRPWLTPERLAPVQAMNVRTRDGSLIRAYLTTPAAAGRGPAPLVVMPHGGPEIRDHDDYDPWAQALAAKGWLVLQPNFRGSGGYGRAFAQAGWKRWGDLMQEDVEDAVDQLIRQRRADPNRVAIFGASYGGYAALMGAVRRPGFYKAAVSIAGPSDLPEMMRFQKRTQKGDATVYDFWRERIGEPGVDDAEMQRASPRLRVQEITAPVLLIHGTRDEIVPPSQSRQMAAALRAAGKRCSTYEIPGAGHTEWGLEAESEVIGRVVDFLAPALAQATIA